MDVAEQSCCDHFSVLQEISNVVVVSDNLHTIAHLMLDLAIRHTRCEKGSMMLLDERNELTILSARGMDEEFSRTYRVRLGEGIAGTVAREGTPVLVKDIDTDDRFAHVSSDRYKTRSFISCPLRGKDRVLGVLNINDKKDGTAFSEEEFALVQIIATQAAVALKNVTLVNRHRAQAAELEELNRKLLDSDLAKNEFLTRISHELRTPLNAIKGAVYYLSQPGNGSGGEQSDFLQIIDNEAQKLISFSEKQLDYLRLEDEGRVVDRKIIQLDKILKEILDSKLLQRRLAERKIELRMDLPQGPFDFVGDRVLVGQLFINLLEGLSTHIEKGALITLSAWEEDTLQVQLQSSVSLPAALVHVFNSRARDWGDRYGDLVKIYLVLKNIDAHGWTCEAKNTAEGFSFSLFIPKNTRQRLAAAIDSTMDMLVEFTSELLNVETCSLMLTDESTGDLSIRAARGLDEDIVRRTRIKVGDRIAGWVAYEKKPLLVEDIEVDPRFGRPNLHSQYASRSLMSLPLMAGEKTIGVLNLNNPKDRDAFTQRDLRLARIFSERISALVHRMQSENCSEKEIAALIASLGNLIHAERAYSKRSFRRAEWMDRILEKMGVSEEERDLGFYAAMIYDLGLSPVDRKILEKEGTLTPSERKMINSHPLATVDLLGDVEFSDQVRQIILHHHERIDGSGYPGGLRGEDIPLISRVLAVVDAFCALTEDRPYRKGREEEGALEELQRDAGRSFDPGVVETLKTMVLQDQAGSA